MVMRAVSMRWSPAAPEDLVKVADRSEKEFVRLLRLAFSPTSVIKQLQARSSLEILA
jgi:hypothetical protein